jgi:hypothetical protein
MRTAIISAIEQVYAPVCFLVSAPSALQFLAPTSESTLPYIYVGCLSPHVRGDVLCYLRLLLVLSTVLADGRSTLALQSLMPVNG